MGLTINGSEGPVSAQHAVYIETLLGGCSGVMLCDVPECSTTFFFFHALPPTVAPAAKVTGTAAGAVK